MSHERIQETAFVTGADRGLGLAFCSGLLERNWRVFAGQFLPAWHKLSELAGQYPGLLDIVSLDVASIESAQSAAQAVASQVDHIDMLINNAGVNTQTKERKISEPDLLPEVSAQAGIELFINPLPDEDHLSMLDWQGEEWPW
jgi:NAD(P)-dependent dehydrogenase (short-subunit alcohol dehydrogenase family)